jgi:hypothetical protein
MAKAKPRPTGTSKTWMFTKDGRVVRSDALGNEEWSLWCNEHDATWQDRSTYQDQPVTLERTIA